MASNSANPTPPTLTATYTSPNNAPFSVAEPVAAPAPSTDEALETQRGQVAAKTQHLASLRDALSKAQDAINKELTARMEEDKAQDANAGKGGASDAKEEENYGEEVAEEED